MFCVRALGRENGSRLFFIPVGFWRDIRRSYYYVCCWRGACRDQVNCHRNIIIIIIVALALVESGAGGGWDGLRSRVHMT